MVLYVFPKNEKRRCRNKGFYPFINFYKIYTHFFQFVRFEIFKNFDQLEI